MNTGYLYYIERTPNNIFNFIKEDSYYTQYRFANRNYGTEHNTDSIVYATYVDYKDDSPLIALEIQNFLVRVIADEFFTQFQSNGLSIGELGILLTRLSEIHLNVICQEDLIKQYQHYINTNFVWHSTLVNGFGGIEGFEISTYESNGEIITMTESEIITYMSESININGTLMAYRTNTGALGYGNTGLRLAHVVNDSGESIVKLLPVSRLRSLTPSSKTKQV